jgi:hypothetical protein
MTAESFGAAAIARHEAKHEAADSLLFNSAGFTFDQARRCWVVTVRGHVVAEPKTFRAVRAFVEMHNGRVAESMV